MSVIEQLSTSKGKRSKEINKELAQSIAAKNNRAAITELAGLLKHQNTNIQSDAIEVLYETGYLRPDLIEGHIEDFIELLSGKNNRLIWGAMIALSCISAIAPGKIFDTLSVITEAVENGSVITKDAGVLLFANLAALEPFRQEAFPLLMHEMSICPPKQLPQYAAKALIAVGDDSREAFLKLIQSRIPELEKPSQIKRINKVLKAIENY